MAQNIKKITIISIATFVGFFGGMRLYFKDRKTMRDLKDKEREKRWSAM